MSLLTLFFLSVPLSLSLSLCQRHLMQCVLLEAGGCASPVEGAVGPDCVYVDQVKATLLQLEGLEAGMEERLNAPPAPCLSCADWFLPSGVGLAGSQGQGQASRDRLSSISRLASALRPLPPRTRRPSPQRSLSDSGSEGGHGDGGGGAMMPPSPGSTPDSSRKMPPGTSSSTFVRRDSLGSGGSDGSGGSGSLFRVSL